MLNNYNLSWGCIDLILYFNKYQTNPKNTTKGNPRSYLCYATYEQFTHFAKCSGKQVKQVQAPNLHVMAQGALGKFKNKGTI